MGLRVEKFVLGLVVALYSLSVGLEAHLRVGIYSSRCPGAETIVREEVSKAFASNEGIAAGLVRMHFHDCFVRGCDGSVLIDSTTGNKAEKDSAANFPSGRGFEVIDSVKARLEAKCKATVSCADILAFAARDSVVLTGGLGYSVPAGRRDGRISRSSEADKLPGPSSNVAQLTRAFARKGLTQAEMVTLSGSHTIGRSHCNQFTDRLYRFNSTLGQNASLDDTYEGQLKRQCPRGSTESRSVVPMNPSSPNVLDNNYYDDRLYRLNSTLGQDPSLDDTYAAQLKRLCPRGSTESSSVVPMDPRSPNVLDNNYYDDVLANRGLFTSDHTLLTNPATLAQVRQNVKAATRSLWRGQFSAAMVKMGRIGVLTGTAGEIRLNCRKIN